MKVEDNVPFSLDEVTAEWLEYALRSNGHIASGTIDDLTVKQIGEDAGFLGQVAILTPKYSSDARDQAGKPPPASMVLKIPTPARSRMFGQMLGVYEREIRFYSELKDKLGVNTPIHYYSAVNETDEPHVCTQRLTNFGKYPIWLMPLVGLIGLIRFGGKSRRSVLLIEDISHLRLGDQLQGASLDDIKKVFEQMARLQAPYWGSPTATQEIPWIGALSDSAKFLQLWFLGSIRRHRKETQGQLSDRQQRIVDWVHTNGVRLFQVLGEQPRALAHHDQRLDNVAFNDETGEAILFDWQTLTFCSAGFELACFLSSALADGVQESDIDELLNYYREQLAEQGAEVSQAYIRWSYEVGMLAMLHRIISLLHQGQIELGDGRGPAVMRKWLQSIYQRLEAIEFEHIFERKPVQLP